jgi:hypothetical protein
MPDATLRIKNLSIALEALSRIAGARYFDDIQTALKSEIEHYWKEKETQWPHNARPAPTTFDEPQF